jgi:hypothetical protein
MLARLQEKKLWKPCEDFRTGCGYRRTHSAGYRVAPAVVFEVLSAVALGIVAGDNVPAAGNVPADDNVPGVDNGPAFDNVPGVYVVLAAAVGIAVASGTSAAASQQTDSDEKSTWWKAVTSHHPPPSAGSAFLSHPRRRHPREYRRWLVFCFSWALLTALA